MDVLVVNHNILYRQLGLNRQACRRVFSESDDMLAILTHRPTLFTFSLTCQRSYHRSPPAPCDSA